MAIIYSIGVMKRLKSILQKYKNHTKNYKIPLWAFGSPKRETKIISSTEDIQRVVKSVEEKLQGSENDNAIDIRIYDSKTGEYYDVQRKTN